MKVEKRGQLKEYLFDNLKGVSKNNVKSLLKYRQVYVNGKAQTQFDYILNVGDEVTISEYRSSEDIEILYEDEHFIAINKPENVLSVRNNKGEYTAISMILKHLDRSNVNAKAFPLHRLDKATSGVFIAAKSAKIKDIMQNNWNEIVRVRGYYAIVEGKVTGSDTIVSNLTENESGFVFSSSEGKKAVTKYKALKHNKHYTLLDVNIETGRKNQIRVHMKEMNHPVVGDLKYGKSSKDIRRLALHAYKLEFIHPITNKVISISSEMPSVFNRVMNKSF